LQVRKLLFDVVHTHATVFISREIVVIHEIEPRIDDGSRVGRNRQIRLLEKAAEPRIENIEQRMEKASSTNRTDKPFPSRSDGGCSRSLRNSSQCL
jgi:hypothetical protein